MPNKVKKKDVNKLNTEFICVRRIDMLKLRESIRSIQNYLFNSGLDKSNLSDYSLLSRIVSTLLDIIIDRIDLYLDCDYYRIDFPFPQDSELSL